jgi:hypothetical protein
MSNTIINNNKFNRGSNLELRPFEMNYSKHASLNIVISLYPRAPGQFPFRLRPRRFNQTNALTRSLSSDQKVTPQIGISPQRPKTGSLLVPTNPAFTAEGHKHLGRATQATRRKYGGNPRLKPVLPGILLHLCTSIQGNTDYSTMTYKGRPIRIAGSSTCSGAFLILQLT